MIGILGGTFDPIHNGHLRTALDVRDGLELDELRLIPLRDPPHRDKPNCTSGQRLEMLEAAIEGLDRVSIDQRELEQEGKSYSLRTVQSLRQQLGSEPICLIMGMDSYISFPNWHKPEEILKLAHLVVMQRPGESGDLPYSERITSNRDQLLSQPGGCIYLQTVTQLDISSTRIRDMLQQGRSPRFLLPDSVLEIIKRDRLYTVTAP